VSVEAAAEEVCGSRDEGILITKSSGYLANSVTAQTNKGSSTCPWILQGQPGQRFSLSLIDYGSSSVEDLMEQLARLEAFDFVNPLTPTVAIICNF